MANLNNLFKRSVLRPPSPSFLRPFQPALESESESTVCVDPQHAMATLLKIFMSGVWKHGIGIEKHEPILNFIMQYCNFPEFVINKMGHCFSIPIPCLPTPDVSNSCNNISILCCGTTPFQSWLLLKKIGTKEYCKLLYTAKICIKKTQYQIAKNEILKFGICLKIYL